MNEKTVEQTICERCGTCITRTVASRPMAQILARHRASGRCAAHHDHQRGLAGEARCQITPGGLPEAWDEDARVWIPEVDPDVAEGGPWTG